MTDASLLASKPHPRIAFQYPDFRYFISSRFLSLCSYQILIVGIAQYIYEKTLNPLDLGYVGLSIFLPKFLFTLFAGSVADRINRKSIVLFCRTLQLCVAIALTLLVWMSWTPLAVLYVLLVVIGTGNAFEGPASQALATQMVPEEHFPNAVTWNSSSMQIAFIVGPALSGGIYAIGEEVKYVLLVVTLLRMGSVLLTTQIRTPQKFIEKFEVTADSVLAGLRYIFRKRVILGAISLDLFAVLLGGAVALMPVFANTILKVGPAGFGALRAAPALGALTMAILLAYFPPRKKTGWKMFFCVALFGIATLVFGLSKNFILSLGALVILGAADMVSVVTRGVLVQLQTPPEMRGRVSAVNLVFVGASNELGEFESGLTAHFFGPVNAVLIGGVGTLLIVVLWAWRFPELRKYEI